MSVDQWMKMRERENGHGQWVFDSRIDRKLFAEELQAYADAETASLRSQLAECQREREEYKGAWEATLADHRAEVNASIIWQQRAESLAQQLQQMKEALKGFVRSLDRRRSSINIDHAELMRLCDAARALLQGKGE